MENNKTVTGAYSSNDMARLLNGDFRVMGTELIPKSRGGYYRAVDYSNIAEILDHKIFLEKLGKSYPDLGKIFRMKGEGYKNSEIKKELGLNRAKFKKMVNLILKMFSDYLGVN
jgi:hypothetical protein